MGSFGVGLTSRLRANGHPALIVADLTVSPPPAAPTTQLAYNALNELVTTTLFNGGGQQVNQATWTCDAAGNQTGNTGYPGTSQPLAITYNQHDQTTSITDAYQHPVAMAWTGPGQAERTSADWSNQPSPPAVQPAEYGRTTYTNSALGVMGQTNTNGTTYYTRDPGGLPISERKGAARHYYLSDGAHAETSVLNYEAGEPGEEPIRAFGLDPSRRPGAARARTGRASWRSRCPHHPD